MRNRLIRRAKVAAAIGAVAITASGCKPEKNFPAEPVIAFKSLAQYQNANPQLTDSASFVVTFTDGDGDIGLSASDLQPPFDTGSTYYYNLFLEMDTVRDGVWGRVQLLLPLHYRIPYITPTGQNKALEGEIAVALKPWPIAGTAAEPWDSVRFSATLVDRALHISNEVLSPPVRVQP